MVNLCSKARTANENFYYCLKTDFFERGLVRMTLELPKKKKTTHPALKLGGRGTAARHRDPRRGPAESDPPRQLPRRRSPSPSPATYGEAADGGALLRQGRVQREAPPRPVLTGEHHHGGLHGAGRAGGSAALCPPRPAAAPFIRPRGD